MKRQDRDSPSKSSKRTCTSVSRLEDHATPDRERGPESPSHGSTGKPSSASSTSRHGKSRGGAGSGGTGSAGASPDRNIPTRGSTNHENRADEYTHASRSYERDYRIVCVSGFSNRVSDATIRDTVYREFKKFGDPDVKLAEDNGERLVYVYFRTVEDAKDARHAKSKLVLFDKPVLVEPVLESGSSANNDRRGRRSSMSPDSISAYTGKSSRNRGGSPTHSTSSLNSLQRRGRRGGSPQDLRVPLGHHDGAYRRDSHNLPQSISHHHPDYLPPSLSGGQPSPRPREEKKEKFPNYLHHIPPEEDDKANRTLFVGNLEMKSSREPVNSSFLSTPHDFLPLLLLHNRCRWFRRTCGPG